MSRKWSDLKGAEGLHELRARCRNQGDMTVVTRECIVERPPWLDSRCMRRCSKKSSQPYRG